MFVDRKKAEEIGIDITKVTSPYDIWDSPLKGEDYRTFRIDDVSALNVYGSDPKFVKTIAFT
jgi:hypothetical protein